MRFLAGLFIGLAVASAGAKDDIGELMKRMAGATMAAGTRPDHLAGPIQVDVNGYVICSTERPPQ